MSDDELKALIEEYTACGFQSKQLLSLVLAITSLGDRAAHLARASALISDMAMHRNFINQVVPGYLSDA